MQNLKLICSYLYMMVFLIIGFFPTTVSAYDFITSDKFRTLGLKYKYVQISKLFQRYKTTRSLAEKRKIRNIIILKQVFEDDILKKRAGGIKGYAEHTGFIQSIDDDNLILDKGIILVLDYDKIPVVNYHPAVPIQNVSSCKPRAKIYTIYNRVYKIEFLKKIPFPPLIKPQPKRRPHDQKIAKSMLLLEIGYDYLAGKDYKQAEKTFRDSIKYNKENAWAYICLGKVYEAKGDKKSARNNYQKILAFKSKNNKYSGLIKEFEGKSADTIALNSIHRLDTPKSPPPIKLAMLTIKSNPSDAKVFLDSKKIGRTPLIKRKVKPGEHKILLKKDKYESVSRIINFKPGRERVLYTTLEIIEREPGGIPRYSDSTGNFGGIKESDSDDIDGGGEGEGEGGGGGGGGGGGSPR